MISLICLILQLVVRILVMSRARATIIYVMVNFNRLLKPTVAAFVLATGYFQPFGVSDAAFAQEAGNVSAAEDGESVVPPQDLASLMQALADADPAQAGRVAGQIRHVWDASGSASADYLLRRTRDAIDAENMQAAVEHATALVDHAPEFAQGWAERARAFYALDLYGPALSDLEQVLALNPKHFDAIMGLALMLDEMGKPIDAYEAYLQVKAIHPHQAGLTEALQRLQPLARGQEL
ncbi:hypothetical protein [Shimia sp.]|uniref:hypothetical protein n=1 Tax=Shimia sp. TaxID=1954381 RepID=UPI003BA9A086